MCDPRVNCVVVYARLFCVSVSLGVSIIVGSRDVVFSSVRIPTNVGRWEVLVVVPVSGQTTVHQAGQSQKYSLCTIWSSCTEQQLSTSLWHRKIKAYTISAVQVDENQNIVWTEFVLQVTGTNLLISYLWAEHTVSYTLNRVVVDPNV